MGVAAGLSPSPSPKRKYVRFTSQRIQPEAEYERRFSVLRRIFLAEGSWSSKWWTLGEWVDEWEMEDMNPDIGPPEKKRRWEAFEEEPETSQEALGVQSPPPGQGLQSACGAEGACLASFPLVVPTTPQGLFDSQMVAAEAAKAELIARNKAAALAKRDAKSISEKPNNQAASDKRYQFHYL